MAADSHIGPEHYRNIGIYVREVVDELVDNYAGTVPVLIWFAWTDRMRNSGILTAEGQPKADIFDAFRHMIARGKEIPEGDVYKRQAASSARRPRSSSAARPNWPWTPTSPTKSICCAPSSRRKIMNNKYICLLYTSRCV